MSIGQTGKRAQQMGQQRLQRHQIKAGVGDQSPLHLPKRQATTPAEPVVARRPDPQPVIQRVEDDTLATTNTSAPQQATTSAPQDGGETSAQQLAEKVYELMKKDLRLERERFGRLRR
ncbi:MAG: hypothetical protein L0154_24520 [Chloroflexi bacterium]|nr:hypothetical protein [Chloroflexota bacterium]